MRSQVPGGPAPKIHSALVGGADHRSDGLTLPEARRYLSRARGSISTGILPQRPNCRNPNSLGLMLASRLWLCAATCPGRVLARDPFGQITAPVTVRNFFLLPKFKSHRLVAECSATTTCISWNKESDPICMRPQTAPHGDSA